MLSFKHFKLRMWQLNKAWRNIAYSLSQISNLNTQASRFRIGLEWRGAKCIVVKQRLPWRSASTVFFWLEPSIELIQFKCDHDVTWRMLRHRKAARHRVLLKLKGESQNSQFENTTSVMIRLMMHGLTKCAYTIASMTWILSFQCSDWAGDNVQGFFIGSVYCKMSLETLCYKFFSTFQVFSAKSGNLKLRTRQT